MKEAALDYKSLLAPQGFLRWSLGFKVASMPIILEPTQMKKHSKRSGHPQKTTPTSQTSWARALCRYYLLQRFVISHMSHHGVIVSSLENHFPAAFCYQQLGVFLFHATVMTQLI